MSIVSMWHNDDEKCTSQGTRTCPYSTRCKSFLTSQSECGCSSMVGNLLGVGVLPDAVVVEYVGVEESP